MRIRNNSLIAWLLLPVAISYFAGCQKSRNERPKNYPDALILLPNAMEVKYYQLGGSFQLVYKMLNEYPAADLIATISSKLKEDKWHALKEDFFNPGLSSSHVRGWTSFEDGTKKPPQIVYQWLADWRSQAGEIVRYGFLYQYDKGKAKDLRHLTVIAIFLPASLAEQTRESALGEFIKKRKAERTE